MSVLTTEPSSMDVDLWDDVLTLHSSFKNIDFDGDKLTIKNTCSYCNGNGTPLVTTSTDRFVGCFVNIDPKHHLLNLVDSQNFQTRCEHISYCPKCGRQLEQN